MKSKNRERNDIYIYKTEGEGHTSVSKEQK